MQLCPHHSDSAVSPSESFLPSRRPPLPSLPPSPEWPVARSDLHLYVQMFSRRTSAEENAAFQTTHMHVKSAVQYLRFTRHLVRLTSRKVNAGFSVSKNTRARKEQRKNSYFVHQWRVAVSAVSQSFGSHGEELIVCSAWRRSLTAKVSRRSLANTSLLLIFTVRKRKLLQKQLLSRHKCHVFAG